MSECQSTYHGRPCNDHGAGLAQGHHHANTYRNGRDTVTTSWNDSYADGAEPEEIARLRDGAHARVIAMLAYVRARHHEPTVTDYVDAVLGTHPKETSKGSDTGAR